MQGLEPVVEEILLELRSRAGIVLVGITGAVASGKSTIARAVAGAVERRGPSARVLSTDSFLFPNDELARRGISMRKGFPESYDPDAIERALGAVKLGRPVELPVYSHVSYDRLPGALERVEPADVIVVEGVIALQEAVRRHINIGIYIDTPEEAVRGWFVERFVGLVAATTDDESSFYRMFADLGADDVRAVAEGAWDAINAVNLKDHIAPSKTRADVVISKGTDHSIIGVTRIDR